VRIIIRPLVALFNVCKIIPGQIEFEYQRKNANARPIQNKIANEAGSR
jgi:hypothetical protein